METRLEHDLLGSLEVPADAYYGIHTLRACENFDISKLGIHPELIRSLALVKKACAIAREALETKKTIRQLALEKKLFTKKHLDTILSPIDTGLPIVLWSKWCLRKSKDSDVEYALLPSSEQLRRKNRLWLVLLMLLLLFGTEFMEDRLHVPWMPGLSLWLCLPILTYPEQKAIYEAAKARLAEDRPQMDA